MFGCHGRGSDHRCALPAVESPTCARVADARKGGGPTSERNTSTLHFKVIRTIFFELCVSLVIILDRPVHQESTEKPGKGPLSYPIAAQKSIRDRRKHLVPFALLASSRSAKSPDLSAWASMSSSWSVCRMILPRREGASKKSGHVPG